MEHEPMTDERWAEMQERIPKLISCNLRLEASRAMQQIIKELFREVEQFRPRVRQLEFKDGYNTGMAEQYIDELAKLTAIVDGLHPRVLKLAARDNEPFIVIGPREPYYMESYSLIREHELEQETWSDIDELAYREATVVARRFEKMREIVRWETMRIRTRDRVPIRLLMPIFTSEGHEGVVCSYGGNGVGIRSPHHAKNTCDYVSAKICYSTREAAEQAQEKKACP